MNNMYIQSNLKESVFNAIILLFILFIYMCIAQNKKSVFLFCMLFTIFIGGLSKKRVYEIEISESNLYLTYYYLGMKKEIILPFNDFEGILKKGVHFRTGEHKILQIKTTNHQRITFEINEFSVEKNDFNELVKLLVKK